MPPQRGVDSSSPSEPPKLKRTDWSPVPNPRKPIGDRNGVGVALVRHQPCSELHVEQRNVFPNIEVTRSHQEPGAGTQFEKLGKLRDAFDQVSLV